LIQLCWLLRISVHKTAELRQYNRSHLPSCLHEKTHKSGNSRRGKLMLNAYTYTSLINQVEKQHVLLVSGWKRDRKIKNILSYWHSHALSLKRLHLLFFVNTLSKVYTALW
jgi:hypothetical protein